MGEGRLPAVSGARPTVATQLGQATRLARDLVLLIASAGRVFVWALRPRAGDPGVAVLAGEPLARAGSSATYRIRALNPGPFRRSLCVVVRGWVDTVPDAGFRIEWTAVLEPGAAAETRLRTDWRGTATLLAVPPQESPIWAASDVAGRWHVEAGTAEATSAPVLHISGALVR